MKLNPKNMKLYSLRNDKGWSQMEASKELNIPINVYSRLERGETSGKVENWSKIQEVYGIPDEKMWSLIKESRRF